VTVTSLCSWLASAGAEVTLVTGWAMETGAPEVMPAGRVQLERYERHPTRLWDFLAGGAMRRVLMPLVKRTDVLHCHGLWHADGAHASRLAWGAGVPYLVSCKGMAQPWALEQRKLKKAVALWIWQKRVLERAAVLHATSLLEKDALRALGLSNPVAMIPCGVDAPEEVIRRPKKERKQRRALFLSRLHPSKGVEDLLRAWAALRPEGWTLRVTGPSDGRYEELLKNLAQELGIAEDVEFLTPVFGMERWKVMVDAELFVLPTYSENFGMVIAEALAAGLPVVTTEAAPWERITEWGCGWRVKTGEEALTEALSQALRIGPERLAEMGERGQRMSRKELSWEKAAQEMLQVYGWVRREMEKPKCVQLD
jgi:glycosyltransferase involved in cell wall biosynthesis